MPTESGPPLVWETALYESHPLVTVGRREQKIFSVIYTGLKQSVGVREDCSKFWLSVASPHHYLNLVLQFGLCKGSGRRPIDTLELEQ